MKLSEVPFQRPVGIELTFLPNRDPDYKDLNAGSYGFKLFSVFSTATIEYQRLLQELTGEGSSYEDYSYDRWGLVHTDPGCVEYASPILHSWEEAHSWYEFAVALGEQLQLTTYHPKQVGGMGHVHMAMSLDEAHRVSWDLITRPYLAWMFAEADQNYYCQSISEIERTGMLAYKPWSGMHSLLRWNDFYRTLEWRGFDSAVDWSEQEEHLAFYQRYAAWCVKNARLPAVTYHGQTLLHFRDKKQGKDRCVRAFRELIKLLELPWRRYSWYVDCHLEAQFSWGKRL